LKRIVRLFFNFFKNLKTSLLVEKFLGLKLILI
jgi:hypothetical protein